MTETLIALFSIIVGIIGAITMGAFNKKWSFGFTGNTIIGVFGGIFSVKTVGRLGISPHFIIQNGEINYGILILNLSISFIGGAIALILFKKITNRIKKKNEE